MQMRAAPPPYLYRGLRAIPKAHPRAAITEAAQVCAPDIQRCGAARVRAQTHARLEPLAKLSACQPPEQPSSDTCASARRASFATCSGLRAAMMPRQPPLDASLTIVWTHWGLTPGPSTCEADVMPLHHVPDEQTCHVCCDSTHPAKAKHTPWLMSCRWRPSRARASQAFSSVSSGTDCCCCC